MDVSQSVFDDFFPEIQVDPPQTPLLQAARGKNYPVLYSLLNRLTEPLELSLAQQLALEGLRCSLHAFQTILDHCPPAAEFAGLPPSSEPFARPTHSVLEEAARMDCPEHLGELLRRGCDPNGDPWEPGSNVLAAAMEGRSLRCVKRLLQEPALDRAPSERLLNAWAGLGQKDAGQLPRCCRAVAPRLPDQGSEPLTFQGVPLPRQMTPSIALDQNNWALAVCLCRPGLSAEDGYQLLENLVCQLRYNVRLQPCRDSLRWRSGPGSPDSSPVLSRQDLATLLDAIFTACPQLPRRRLAQTLLFFTVLSGKRTPEKLVPWLERVRGRKVVLDLRPGFDKLSLVLPFWRERLGERWTPTLDPRGAVYWRETDTPRELEILLSQCRTLRFRPGRQITPLSRLILHMAPMPLLLRQLQPGGLLREENPRVLLDYCGEKLKKEESFFETPDSLCPLTRQRWQAVLLHTEMEADYEL